MTPFLLDLLVLLIIGFCIWQGYRKGLILTVSGIVIVLLSAWAAGAVANHYSASFAEQIRPVFGWLADDAIDEAARGNGRLDEITDTSLLTEIAQEAFHGLGFSFVEKGGFVDEVFDEMAENERTFREAVSYTFLHGLSYMILCVFGFVVVMILLTLLLHFIAAIFKLPVLNKIDKIGGSISGLVYAVLILTVLGWALRYTGMFIPQETLIEKTFFLKMFYKSNILTGLLGTLGR